MGWAARFGLGGPGSLGGCFLSVSVSPHSRKICIACKACQNRSCLFPKVICQYIEEKGDTILAIPYNLRFLQCIGFLFFGSSW